MTDTILRAPRTESLSLEDMRRSLPAIFASQPHASRSSHYVYVSTEEMLDAMISNDFDPVEARVSLPRDTERRAFAKHMIRFRHRDTTSRQVGDTILEIVMRNSHDGSASYEMSAGLFKLLCLNGLVVSDGTIGRVRVRHAGDNERQLQQVVEGAEQILERAPAALEAPRRWPSITLSRDEQIAFSESARIARFGDAQGNVEAPFTAEQLLHPRRPDDEGNDLWHTFNRVQENVVRGGLYARYRDSRNRWRTATTREVKSIDGDMRLNRALWTLAAKMAEIKMAA